MVRGQMPYGLSEAEIEWLREGYRMFREGDPAFMDRYEADAEIIIPASLPAGGIYAGPWEAMEFWTTVAELVDDPYPDPEEFIRVEDRVIVLGTWRARTRDTGEEIALRIVHAFRMTDGRARLMDTKTVSAELFVDTVAFLQAIGRVAPEAP
jgi:ketosteroid isomerase-like protein